VAKKKPVKKSADDLPPRYSGDTDDPDIKELHDSFDYATDAIRDIRNEARVDMRCIGGDVWEPNDRDIREAAGRPCLSLDEFGQYVNQIINDVRQNKRAIKVTPLGNGANDASAALRADLYRQIEYRSNAQQAYTTMFENAVQRSYGYLRIKPQYVNPRSRHQELLIDPIMNPDLVTPDPDAIKPDLADIKYLFLQESWSKTEFKKRFKKAAIQDFTQDMATQAPRWVKDERIMLAEWWQLTTQPKKLLYVDVPAQQVAGQPPSPPQEFDILEDEFRDLKAKYPKAKIVGSRMADMPKVRMRLTNGLEILEETPWLGQYIPFVGCYGKILYMNDGAGPTKRILSSIRLAIPPAMLYCYYRTGEAETVGMATKFPYFVRQGSLAPEEAVKLAKSNHEPVEFIQVKLVGDDIPPGVVPEMPVRNPFEPAIQALEVGAEGARRAIQAAMGISPLPTSAQRRNEKSGVALKQIDESAQKGTFHFIDHYEMSVTRAAVIIDDLIPHYYDAARDLTVRKPDDTPVQVRVNDPNQPAQASSGKPFPYGEQPSIGPETHDVTLSTGPSFDSEREAANDFSDVIVNNIERIAQVAGQSAAAKIIALSIKLKNIGPLGNEMADIISPPEQDGQPNAAQLMQENQQLKGAVQQLQQEADDNKTKFVIAQHGDALKFQVEQIKAQTAITVAEISSKSAEAVADMKAQIQVLSTLIGTSHEERLAEKEHQTGLADQLHTAAHEVGMAAMEHHQAQQLADQQHQQTLEQGQQAHEQNIEAAQIPPPIDPNAQPPSGGE